MLCNMIDNQAVICFMVIQLQNAVFQPAKVALLACKRYSFMMQKASS